MVKRNLYGALYDLCVPDMVVILGFRFSIDIEPLTSEYFYMFECLFIIVFS